jgi:amino acid adenylation domain-containing protein
MATRTEAPRSETADRGPQDARARLLALRRRPQSQPPSAAAAAPRGPVPATPAQRALWLAERVADTDGAFNTAFAVRLRGPLDRDALDGAFVGLLRRHEALRTRIVEVDGLPTLSVEPVGDARLEIVESPPGRADGPAAETALAAALREHARRPFDLARAPLARACLFALGPDDHVLLFVAHHVASDGWSRRIVARELGTLYAALAGDPRRAGDAAHAGDTTHAGRAAHAAAAALPPIATGFAAHAAREHDRDGGPGRARALQAWRERLDGLEPAGLPHDRPRAPDAPMPPAAVHRFTVAADTVRALRRLARDEGATLYMVLLAAFDLLLMRWSGRDDVAVATPVAGRDRPELEALVGCFADLRVLRTDLSGNPAFRTLIGRARRTTLEALEAGDVPFERLLEALAGRRGASAPGANPLVAACLALHNQPSGELALPGLQCSPVPVDARAAQFDLTLDLTETGEALHAALEHAADVIDASTAGRFAAQFVRLLESIAADPDRRLDALPVIDDAERHRLLERFNDTAAPFPEDRCLHELIAAQARSTPDAVAVVFGSRSLTYAELDASANRLAHRLAELGAGVGERVAVCVARSERMLVALLAAMKAGAAYLPLDPDTPDARLAMVIDDATPRVLVGETGTIARIAAAARSRPAAVDLDLDAAALAALPASAPPVAAGPRDLAYVMYTSGSTGRPKGVLIEHRGLVNNVWWQIRAFGIGASDRFLQRSTIVFDASCWELWTPLCVGAATVIVDRDTLRDPSATLRAIVSQRLTVAQAVPSFFSLMLAELEHSPRPLPLRLMAVGGEALPAADVRRWWRVASAELVNCYGPTEGTIDATFERCPREDVPATVPIGRPIDNARVVLLDPSGALTPHGGVGELHVGGAGVARGYLGRDTLTAERFLPDPFRPGERLYRTGDLGRVLADGRIEFLGRRDDQVKIGGVRIEPGEVEAALAACEGVARAAVLVRADDGGAPRLVAYAQSATADPAALRAQLARTLPESMLPASIVVLERLPELPSGKLDRGALPAPAPRAAGPGPSLPRTPLEAAIATAWAEALGVASIGVDDDFFAAGGNSLLAARAASRVRAATGADPGLRAMFEARTVAALATRIEAGRVAADGVPAPVRTDLPDDAVLPLDATQRAIAYAERAEPSGGLYNVPLAMRLHGTLSVDALRHALDALVARHGALRTRLVGPGDAPAQQAVRYARVPLAVRRADANALPGLLREEAAAPFVPERAPLVRATLFALGPRDHALLVVIHHLVVDGASLRRIVDELAELYAARLAGREARLPALPVRFVDWIAWRGGPGASDDAPSPRHGLDWWRDRLAGLEPLPLPLDRAAAPDAGAAGERVTFDVPADVARALRAAALSAGTTPFVAALAGFQALLARWCGHADVAVGTPVAGRDRIELEPLVGCLVDMVVLRTDLGGDPGFGEALARARRTALDAFEHAGVPFDRLVAALRPRRERGVNPLFQVAFTFDDAPPPVPRLPGVRCEPLPVHTGTAKFALSLALSIRDGTLTGAFEYRTAAFERATIESLAERYVALLRAGLADPLRPLRALALDDPARARALLALGAGPARPPAEGDIAARFDTVVRRSPDATAIVDGPLSLDYAALDAKSLGLARRLRALGVTPGELVALCVERSAAHVVAMLAVLRAGAAYLPIDAALPAERIAQMLGECRVRAAVVDARGAALPAFEGPGAPTLLRADADPDTAQIVDPDAADAVDPARTADAVVPAPAAHRDPLACVIYTSGSTGRPKGVRVPQRGILRLVLDTDYVALGPGSVVAQASTCAFDAASFEIWGALLNGATLAIVPRETLLDADALAGRIARDRIDTMFVTTALFNELVARRPALFAGMDTVLFGGEAADARTLGRVLEAGPPRRLLNVYGPTETTTFATWHDVTAACARAADVPARVPIGRPIAGAVCRVLDRFGALAPVGTVGDLLVGGHGVSPGYLGRPELDAERFVDDPYAPGERLYRTGDRVRWTQDGVLEFVGRLDDQVKVRGYRIELGEIEAALRRCDGVRDAVVAVHDDGHGDRRLVAFVVQDEARAAAGADGSPAAPPTAQRLRRALRDALPEYMLPGAIVPLAALPLNANGKVDRRALPDTGRALQADATLRRVAAEGAADGGLEAGLAALWREVLGVPAVGPDDDFFDLGGHSLLALRLLAGIERRHGRALPLAALLEAPTVRALAGLLRRAGGPARRSCVVPVQPRGSRAPLFVMSGWGGALMVFSELARALGPDQPIWAIDAAAFDVDELARLSLPQVAARMREDLGAVQPEGPVRLCGFSMGGKFVHEIARQLRAAGRPVELLALLDCDAPGYPRRRRLASRVLHELRDLARRGPRGAASALADRIGWHLRVLRGEDPRGSLFAADEALAHTSAARAMSATTDAMLRLWHGHEPGHRHEGRLLLVRAGRRDPQPAVIDDDDALGWRDWADAVVARTIDCEHRRMLDADQAPALAALLEPYLAPDPAREAPAQSFAITCRTTV